MNNEIVASLCFEKIVTGNITLSFKGLKDGYLILELMTLVYLSCVNVKTNPTFLEAVIAKQLSPSQLICQLGL